MMVCGCDPGANACDVAQRLFRAYRAAEEAELELLHATTAGDNADDPVLYQRWQLAGDEKRKAYKRYQRHIDGDDDLPEPQSLRVGPKGGHLKPVA